MCTCGSNTCGGCCSMNIPTGPPGEDGIGWSPVFAVVSDGPTREVLQLVNWVGGTGTPPGGINQYVSTTGLTTVIADASNIRGTDGVVAGDQVTAQPDQTISSPATATVLTGCTASPAAGDYLVWAEAEFVASAPSSAGTYGIYVNGVLTNLARRIGANGGGSTPLSWQKMVIFGKVTVATGQAIDVRVSVTADSFTISRFTMIYQKVG